MIDLKTVLKNSLAEYAGQPPSNYDFCAGGGIPIEQLVCVKPGEPYPQGLAN